VRLRVAAALSWQGWQGRTFEGTDVGNKSCCRLGIETLSIPGMSVVVISGVWYVHQRIVVSHHVIADQLLTKPCKVISSH
jgi:hypothetical protein